MEAAKPVGAKKDTRITYFNIPGCSFNPIGLMELPLMPVCVMSTMSVSEHLLLKR
jgi:hypothetical protein